jgi:hypothetical protein
MSIAVDIADRQFDYTDEERAAEAVAEFQLVHKLDDDAIVDLWSRLDDPMRVGLEKAIFDAVDRNGSARRAAETIPGGVSLVIEAEDTES